MSVAMASPMPTLPSLGFTALTLAALVGCNSTVGTDDRASFAYESGHGCLLSCDTGKPLMLGTTESLTVTGIPATNGITLTASASSVVAVGDHTTTYTCDAPGTSTTSTAGDACPSGTTKHVMMEVSILALAAGHAMLDVNNADGSLFDSLPLTVLAPAKLQLVNPDDAVVSSVTVAHGVIVNLSMIAFDAHGVELQASQGFTFAAADPTIADTQEHDFTVVSPDLAVHGDAPGTTSITVSAASAETSLAVTVQ